jgi:hypothetical protein
MYIDVAEKLKAQIKLYSATKRKINKQKMKIRK